MLYRFLRYRFVKFHLHAYINHELSPQTRRLVARFIDEDARCYQAYLEQRQLTQDIGRTISAIGRSDDKRLDAIWSGIQSQLAQPMPSNPVLPVKSMPIVQYGFAIVLLMCLLAIPAYGGMRPNSTTGLPVLQALPDSQYSMTTPAVTNSVFNSTRVAQTFVTPAPTGILNNQSLDNTPALSTPSH